MDRSIDRVLFGEPIDEDPRTYPDAAGFKGEHETGRDAAADINKKLGRIKRMVRDAIAASERKGLTPEECAHVTGEPRVTCQPRFSELKSQGVIVPSGERRTNPSSGKSAVVWVMTEYGPPAQGGAGD
jgi:hypothetical protein